MVVKTPKPQTLDGALLEAQRAVKPVQKDSRNDHTGYDYASAEAIITESRSALIGAGLVARRSAWTIGTKNECNVSMVEMTFILSHPESAEQSSHVIQFPAQERKGTPLDKAVAAALTSGQAYWLRDLLLIPRVDHEMDKADDSGYQPQRGRQTSNGQRKPPAVKEQSKYMQELPEMEQHNRTLNALLKEIGVTEGEQTDAIYALVTQGKIANREACHDSLENKRLVTKALDDYCAKTRGNGKELKVVLEHAQAYREQSATPA